MLPGTPAARARAHQEEGDRNPALTAEHQPEFRGLVHDLVEGGIDERGDLELHHRAKPRHRRPVREAGERRFRDRHVEHPAGVEALVEAAGLRPHPVSDVLSEDDHRVVFRHRLVQGFVERSDIGERSHCSHPRAGKSV